MSDKPYRARRKAYRDEFHAFEIRRLRQEIELAERCITSKTSRLREDVKTGKIAKGSREYDDRLSVLAEFQVRIDTLIEQRKNLMA